MPACLKYKSPINSDLLDTIRIETTKVWITTIDISLDRVIDWLDNTNPDEDVDEDLQSESLLLCREDSWLVWEYQTHTIISK